MFSQKLKITYNNEKFLLLIYYTGVIVSVGLAGLGLSLLTWVTGVSHTCQVARRNLSRCPGFPLKDVLFFFVLLLRLEITGLERSTGHLNIWSEHMKGGPHPA